MMCRRSTGMSECRATRPAIDLLDRAREQFLEEPSLRGEKPVVLAEMTLRSLLGGAGTTVGHDDFLARADVLHVLGFDVLISRFQPYYELADYLAAYTDQMIGIAVGLPGMKDILDERYYGDLSGGVLESVYFFSCQLWTTPPRLEIST